MPHEQIPKRYAPDAIHLIRTTQQIQVQLSAMADHKASILMGATFVVFTITLNQTSRGLVAPEMLVLAGFALLSAAFAVMAVLPAVKPKPGAPLNLLFFGSFTQLEQEDYIERLIAELGDEQNVYRTMARDIYQNGSVLKRKKYRYLALAYHTFLAGMVMTVLTFGADRLGLL
ncbi:Pycsar system effector family protein [Sphingomonas sp. ID1715]|uniref:Pycsar system effector family protein n=1 Tax=Sphingomonas sp. ID1715 TaxID=1656898 RepID=UPI001C2B96D9|nr:Pycsar system effector family protein [Sphingomonas sp. ID1715]